ncbi:MAG: S4 domain-containing protein, partial [Candidatus Kapaibacteriota bacterium]
MKSKIKEDFSVYSKAKIRLNRLIAEAGITSRRKADELIQSGAVKVNGRVVTKLGTVVSWDDLVTVDGKPVKLLQKY